jgi:hypothetical protein
MPPLPDAIIRVFAPFAPLFSPRVWGHAPVLLLGALLARGARPVTAALRVMGLSGTRHVHLVNLLHVNLIMRQEPTSRPPVVNRMRRWEGSCGPAKCRICAASLAGRPKPTSDAVAGGSVGPWDHRPRENAGRAPVT